jgi:hypothetical protein
MSGHVIYESRLELTRLLYADFDRATEAVLAQPFLLSARVDGRRARYAISREQFRDLHHGQRLSFTEIGQRTGYSRTAISDLARAYEIPTSIYRDGKQLKAPANVEG